MARNLTITVLTLLSLCAFASTHPVLEDSDNLVGANRIDTTDRQNEQNDGLVGICPAGVLLPISSCFCFALFDNQITVTNQRIARVGCRLFIGSRNVILMKEGYCIPFLNQKRELNKNKLINQLNRLLKVCESDTRATLA